ncbi:MAG: outer membrane beta-barrel protein [Bacteroidales bacterium]|nr:outer membrane beta-barrel protein [Bacteroidales bacterium]
MKKIFMMALMATLMSIQAIAQYNVKFQVNDSTGEGEAFATVRIYKAADANKAVSTGVTTLEGAFTQEIATAGAYKAEISAVGKVTAVKDFSVSASQKTADLGTIVLGANANVLQGVTVTAAAPVVKSEIDRISYNVQNDADSKSRNVLDMLRKVPLVTVDGQDNITVKGSGSYKIFKNGHPDPGLSQNAKEVLKAIPASMIKRIEVITDPGAKYDAEGVTAILNIVTFDASSTSTSGVTGTVSVGASDRGNPEAMAYLTTQVGKVVASINYGYHHQTKHNDMQHNEYFTRYTETGNELTDVQDGGASVNVHFGNIDASYEPDTLNLLSLSFGGYYYNYMAEGWGSVVMRDKLGQTIYSHDKYGRIPGNNFFSFNGRFDYQHKTRRPDETLTLSYMLSTSHNKNENEMTYSNMVGSVLPYTQSHDDVTENFLEQTVQFDWTRPFAKYNKFETGLKYINRSNKSHSIFDYKGYPEGDHESQFKHLTQVAAAYFSYTFNKGPWAARAGLRYEFSHLSAKFPDGSQKNFHSNLSDWVPMASVQYKFDMFNTLKLTFNTTINRPGISYLNPAVVITPESKTYGNSDLKSVHKYAWELNYMHMGQKFTFSITPNFDICTNGIATKQWSEGNIKHTTYVNGLFKRWIGVWGYVQYNLVKTGTSVMVNGGIGYDYFKNEDLGIRNYGTVINFFTNLTQQLPAGFRLSAWAGCFGGNPEGLYSKSDREWYHGFNLQRSFLKEDRLTVSINARNPFHKINKWHTHTVNGNYSGYEHYHYMVRDFSIKVSYRFGSLKANVKKTATTIENNDLVGGSTAGGQGQQGGQSK